MPRLKKDATAEHPYRLRPAAVRMNFTERSLSFSAIPPSMRMSSSLARKGRLNRKLRCISSGSKPAAPSKRTKPSSLEAGRDKTRNSHSRSISRCIHSWNAKRLIDRLCEFRVLSLPASKEEGFVLLDGAAGFEPELMHLNFRFRRPLRASEELIRIEGGIAEKLKERSVKFIRTAAGRNRYGCSAVASFFRRGIVGGDFVFLNVIGVQPVQIRERVRY